MFYGFYGVVRIVCFCYRGTSFCKKNALRIYENDEISTWQSSVPPEYYGELPSATMYCGVLQYTTMYYTVLQCTTEYYSTVYYTTLWPIPELYKHPVSAYAVSYKRCTVVYCTLISQKLFKALHAYNLWHKHFI